MWISERWTDYKLIDGGNAEKLEKWGAYTYSRPDPQIIWDKSENDAWNRADAMYHRNEKGGGFWDFINKSSDTRQIISREDLKFVVKPMGFKHMGLFPEQAVNWDFMRSLIEKEDRKIRVLNLFAYTGGATVACLKAGAFVCHVDAAKGIVAHAKENVEANGLSGENIRYIVDDCLKFVQREARRGKTYDAIIMDPPSYGRGPGGEVWKIEDELYGLITSCIDILSDNPLFFLINSYTTGLASTSVANTLKLTMCKKFGGSVSADEIGLPFSGSDIVLPCGCTARWQSGDKL